MARGPEDADALAERMARLLDAATLDELLAELPPGAAAALNEDWRFWARDKQREPPGDWRIWLLLAGRGFGKTRSGAEWVRGRVERGLARRIALVAPTASDARDVMIEGESGLLAVSRRQFRPRYEPSKRRLTWPSGAVATAFSADEPERLRGPQHDAAWCDELAAWRRAEAWDMLLLGLRLGADPRAVVTTTPRPVRLIRALLAAEDVVVTRGSSYENQLNLAPAFLAEIVRRYEGTRLGRQELAAELLEDAPGTLWQRGMFEREGMRVEAPPALARIVVAVDPAASANPDSDETGIVVAGLGEDGQIYVLEDLSGRLAPHEWAARAVDACRRHQADRIVAEVNNGGDLVETNIRMVDGAAPFQAVRASRGKAVRAEPVATLYEQGRVHHCGVFPALEDQMCAFARDFAPARGGRSPDRADALIWAVTELVLTKYEGWGVMEFYRRADAKRKAGL